MLYKDKEVQYALFETGNDEPWEEDLIEFENNEKVVIHRGSCQGLYKYRYDGIIVDREVDAVDLINYGMAKKTQVDICLAWSESGIRLSKNCMVIRNILNYPIDSSDGDYIVQEGNKYFVVNKYYLITQNLAELDGDKLMDEMPLKRMSYKGNDTPWKEDKIFFLSKNVEKGREPGWYKVKVGSIMVNRRTEHLLRDGLAMKLSERAKYYFGDYCKEQGKKQELSDIALTNYFKEVVYANSDYIVNDSFKIFSLDDFVICYVSYNRNIIPSGKVGQLAIFIATPEIIEKFQSAINAFTVILDKCQQRKSVCLKRLTELEKKLADLETGYSTFTASPDFSVWTSTATSKRMSSYQDFYLRAVKKYDTWEAVVARATQLETAFTKASQTLNIFYNEDTREINAIKSRAPIADLGRGVREDMEKLERKKQAFQSHALFSEVVDSYESIKTRFGVFEQKMRTYTSIIKEDNLKITEKRKTFDRIKEIVKTTKGPNTKGKLIMALCKKFKPWGKSLKFIRKDFLIERIAYGKTISEDLKNWNLYNCYLLTVSKDEKIYVFDEALCYIGLAIKK